MDWDGTLLDRVMKPAEERFIRQFDSCIRSDKKDALQPLIDELLHLLNADIFDSHFFTCKKCIKQRFICEYVYTSENNAKYYILNSHTNYKAGTTFSGYKYSGTLRRNLYYNMRNIGRKQRSLLSYSHTKK